MRERLVELRARAAAQGCDFLAATTLREPVERDISDEVRTLIINPRPQAVAL